MARRDPDDFLEEEWSPEGDDDDAEAWDDGPGEEDDWIECPECGRQIHVESEQCPHCGHYIVDDEGTDLWRGRSWWWIALGVVGIIAVVVALAMPS